MRLLRRFALILGLLLAVFLLLPSPIDPLGWDPSEPPPLAGALAPNERLIRAERLGEGEMVGPEDAIVDGEGRIYGAAEDGRIVRLTREGERWRTETFAQTGGRPLGIQWDGAGNLVVCDATRGLLSVDDAGQVTLLTERADNLPFKFTDDVDIASDGRIYFSDASSRWDKDTYLFDLLEARPWGRLLRYDPATGKTETLLQDLYFANGVALSQHEDFVLVNETYRYRITRYWLKGERAGTSDIFLDNLPGIADGISSNRRGTFWVAMFTRRNERADFYHRQPFLKRQLAKLPRAFWPKPERYGFVVALDENAQVTESLHDPTGERVPQVTSAWEHEGWLYLGNLTEPYLSRVRLR